METNEKIYIVSPPKDRPLRVCFEMEKPEFYEYKCWDCGKYFSFLMDSENIPDVKSVTCYHCGRPYVLTITK